MQTEALKANAVICSVFYDAIRPFFTIPQRIEK